MLNKINHSIICSYSTARFATNLEHGLGLGLGVLATLLIVGDIVGPIARRSGGSSDALFNGATRTLVDNADEAVTLVSAVIANHITLPAAARFALAPLNGGGGGSGAVGVSGHEGGDGQAENHKGGQSIRLLLGGLDSVEHWESFFGRHDDCKKSFFSFLVSQRFFL